MGTESGLDAPKQLSGEGEDARDGLKAWRMTRPREFEAKVDAMLAEVKALHRMLLPANVTLAEFVEWEREFGPERDGRQRVELCKSLARRFGVTYREVDHVLPWFADDGAA